MFKKLILQNTNLSADVIDYVIMEFILTDKTTSKNMYNAMISQPNIKFGWMNLKQDKTNPHYKEGLFYKCPSDDLDEDDD